MAESEGVQGPNPQEQPARGQLIGEFPDVRAQALRIVGPIIGVFGVAFIAAGFRDGVAPPAFFGVFVIGVGAAVFALGTWRKTNRVLVCTAGLVQVTSRKVETYLWQDVQEVILDRERSRYVLGAVQFQTSRNTCYLQLKGGGWVQVKIAPISGSVVKAIRQSWQAWQLASRIEMATNRQADVGGGIFTVTQAPPSP
jgi:hypothetical protein